MDWRQYRKAGIRQRRTMLEAEYPGNAGLAMSAGAGESLDFAEVMVEGAFGILPIPLGMVPGFLIDGKDVALCLASEEPSVLAAAGYAAAIVSRAGGFTTWALEPIMQAHVYIQGAEGGAADSIRAAIPHFSALLEPLLSGMKKRGGGLRGIETSWIEDTLRVELAIDVRDAMGANILNTCAETLRPELESISRGRVLMAILSNGATGKRAGARCAIPVDDLARAGFTGKEMAERIVAAYRIAEIDPERAVTHNKGIMNGISALALATANDTRAVEAAAHAWAARSGAYRSLSTYRIENGYLMGSLEIPVAMGTVGGAVSFHPAAAFALEAMGKPDAALLSRWAVALGLAQNFAALFALVGEGIQQGHMRLHAKRIAFAASARGDRIREVAAHITEKATFSTQAAQKALAERTQDETLTNDKNTGGVP